jgi:acetyl-CoA carboxylase carboxyltransferase component
MSADNSTERLRQMKREALHSGGPERIEARRRRGAIAARERVLLLLDAGTFVELDVFVDGAVTGHGKIEGRDVYIFSQDGEAPRDPGDELFARKVAKIMDLAMKNGAPLIGFYDGGFAQRAGGAIHREDAGSLGGYAELYFRNVMASGLVPQIAAVVGPCAGAAVYSPALADFTIMVKGSSHAFLSDPTTGRNGAEEQVAFEELGGARAHSEKSGFAHLAADDETECLEMIRRLLSYLPQNNLEEPPRVDLLIRRIVWPRSSIPSPLLIQSAPVICATSSLMWWTKETSSRSCRGGRETWSSDSRVWAVGRWG